MISGIDRRTPIPPAKCTTHWTTDVGSYYSHYTQVLCIYARFHRAILQQWKWMHWTNTEQLVFTKPYPQKGFMKTWNYVFQTFQFRLNLTGTKPQFAEIFRYYITEAEIIQNWGFRSTLKSRSCWQLTSSCLLRGHEGSLLWIDILSFFVTDWYIFEVVCWVLVRLICSRSHFYPCFVIVG